MMLLVSGATPTVARYIGHPNLGQLVTPRDGNRVLPGMVFAADNAAYSDWDEDSFIRMLDRLTGTNPLFVTCPDFVGNARITHDLFDRWSPEILKRGLPLGYVLQDGSGRCCSPPWDDISAVFIGGSTEFKFAGHTRYLVHKAKEHGKWVHMGRVNSLQRLQAAFEMGCDSCDGSGFSRFAELKLGKALRYLQGVQLGFGFEQMRLAA